MSGKIAPSTYSSYSMPLNLIKEGINCIYYNLSNLRLTEFFEGKAGVVVENFHSFQHDCSC